ncbi:hypothetical protein C5167_029585 [Papaver somniferum]|nr:hypothetical protein C5167_029585 [Papaver somniferum]
MQLISQATEPGCLIGYPMMAGARQNQMSYRWSKDMANQKNHLLEGISLRSKRKEAPSAAPWTNPLQPAVTVPNC